MNVTSYIFMRRILFSLLALMLAAPVFPAIAADSAVVLMYHRVGESSYPSTNVTIEQFESHLAEIARGGYKVVPLPTLVKAVREGRKLDEKTIAISIDDAFSSVYREAWPRFKKAGIPFSLFVATDPVDNRTGGYMSWDQIRELRDGGVTIGSQTATHPHMPLQSADRNRVELEKSNARFRKELGNVPDLIAYPYGEYSLAVGKVARDAGFVAGFGQHSGVVNGRSDFFYLPRFAFNESFGDLRRFRMAARALPIPVTDVTPADPFLGTGTTNPPAFGFTVEGPVLKRLSRLACYASHEGPARIERLGEQRIEVRMTKPFPNGRSRINCTLPAQDGRWHWFGLQFLVPRNR